MEATCKIVKQKVLAVEGKDECNFFMALLKELSINDVQMIDIGGKERFRVELPILIRQEGFEAITALGFIRDAEEHQAARAFESICGILSRNNLPVPTSLGAFTPGPPKIGVFIMPDNQGVGMLENLCLKTLAGEPIERCINDYVACLSAIISTEDRAQFNMPKARVQTYLAGKTPIVNSLGLGALHKYWDFSHPCFTDLKHFLHALFEA